MFLINVTSSTASKWVHINFKGALLFWNTSVYSKYFILSSNECFLNILLWVPGVSGTHRISEHHVWHPRILRLYVLLAPVDFEAIEQFQIPNTNPAPEKIRTHYVALGLLSNLAGDLINEQIIWACNALK